MSLLAGIVAGCSFPYDSYLQGSSASNAVTKDVVQANVDSLLDSIAQTGGDVEDEELLGETFLVKNKIALGDIEIKKNTIGKFSIIEITPNTNYPICGYMVGGMEPLDKYALDAMANREIGMKFSDDKAPTPAVSSYLSGGFEIRNNDYADGPVGLGKTAAAQLLTKNRGEGPLENFVTNKTTCKGYMQNLSLVNNGDRDAALGGTYAIKKAKIDVGDSGLTVTEDRGVVFISEYAEYKKPGDSIGDNEVVYYPEDFCWVWKDGECPEDGYDYSNFNRTSYDYPNNPANQKYISFDNVEKRQIYNNEMLLLKLCGLEDRYEEFKDDDGNEFSEDKLEAMRKYGLFQFDIYNENWAEFRGLDATKVKILNDFYGGKTLSGQYPNGENLYSDYFNANTLNLLHSVANPKVKHIVCEPGDLTEEMVNDADLIFVHEKIGDLYNNAKILYDFERGSGYELKDSFSADKDIADNIAELIEERVNANELTIAWDLRSRDNGSGKMNDLAKRLFPNSNGSEFQSISQVKVVGNKILFDDNTQIFFSTGGTQTNLGTAIQNTDHKNPNSKTTKIGEVEYLGAGFSGDSSRNPALITREKDAIYQLPISSFEIDDVTQESGKRKIKVLYLNELQYEKAKTSGIDVYCQVKVEKQYDLFTDSNFNGEITLTNSNISELAPCENVEHLFVDDHRYAEFKFEIPSAYFNTITIPTQFNLKNGKDDMAGKFDISEEMGEAAIKASVTMHYPKNPSGNDVLLIVVRDTFDLD